jgi:hypothetical protein
MRIRIGPAAASLALAIAVSTPAAADRDDWPDRPAKAKSGCVGFINKDGRKDHNCGFGPENPEATPGVTTKGDIARELRARGLQIYDIRRHGKRFEAAVVEADGDLVIYYFDRSGDFIKKRRF